MIDSYLRSEKELDDHVIHLLFSANRWELAYVFPRAYIQLDHVVYVPYRSSIEETLCSGETIICDRYAFSGTAFSASKVRPGSKGYPLLDYAWCRSPDIGLPAPDITLFLDVSPDAARTRGGYGEERYEKEDVQRRVRDVFVRIGDEVEGAGRRWLVIDADESQEDVQKVMWDAVKDLVGGVDEPIEKLWDDKREATNVDALYM